MKSNKFILIVFSLFFFLTVFSQEEKIYLFKSEIAVQTSGDLIITETIKIHANGQDIKRGIFRAIPNTYKTKSGRKFKVDYEVLEILRDGSIDDFHIKSKNGYSYIYVGNRDYFLPVGDYEYTIKYKTSKQIGFYEDFDEIYWNVNGNEWDFVIDKIEAEITLPGKATIGNYTAYTGAFGESGDDYLAVKYSNYKIWFETTEELFPNENMTIAVAWQKGIVYEPTFSDNLMGFFKDNLIVFIGLLGALFAFFVHLYNWKKVGVDPVRGAVIPIFKPFGKLSPSAMRYILKMKIDDKAFTAAIVSMATKGVLKINKKTKIYHLIKEQAPDVTTLSKSELVLYKYLFKSGDIFKLSNSRHSQISGAMQSFDTAEKALHQETYFKLNRKFLIPGVLFSVLAIVAMVMLKDSSFNISTLYRFAPIGFFVFIMLKNIKTMHKNVMGIVIVVLVVFFFLFYAGAFGAMTSFESIVIAIVVVFLVFINLLFAYLMKAPTLFGRKEMDKIEGFKMYLKTAEEDRLNAMNIPDKTPKLFEKYLPYAIALDCENQWADKFKDIINEAINAGTYSQPTWYIGNRIHFSPKNFTNDIGRNLNDAVRTSSTPPSQRGSGGGGGSMGGGFSGGGGGGGGGGGW